MPRRKGILGKSYIFPCDIDTDFRFRRLINHSCDPNCTAKIITINGEKKIVIYAKQDIELGDEITYGVYYVPRRCYPPLKYAWLDRLPFPYRAGQNSLPLWFCQVPRLSQLDTLLTYCSLVLLVCLTLLGHTNLSAAASFMYCFTVFNIDIHIIASSSTTVQSNK